MKIKRHRWTEGDDGALREAVSVVFGEDDDERSRKVATWSAVAGRLLPGLVVTPAACRARMASLERSEREEAERVAAEAEGHAERLNDEWEARGDGWARAEAMLAEYEEDAYDRLNGRLDSMERTLDAIAREVGELLAAWR